MQHAAKSYVFCLFWRASVRTIALLITDANDCFVIVSCGSKVQRLKLNITGTILSYSQGKAMITSTGEVSG
jgi:hypothetical protein